MSFNEICRADVTPCPSISLTVIRAKVVGEREVDSGNDIYGNPIKRIQYEVKQIKVSGLLCRGLILRPGRLHSSTLNGSIPDVQGSKPGHRNYLHCSCVSCLWSYPGCHWQEGVSDLRFVLLKWLNSIICICSLIRKEIQMIVLI